MAGLGVFSVVTLPVELEASRTAVALLARSGIAQTDELREIRDALRAAALTSTPSGNRVGSLPGLRVERRVDRVTLIDRVRLTCEELAPHGWRDLLLDATDEALDLHAPDLAAELSKPLPAIDRTLPGFEDFAPSGERGIEPGAPARSLLYHALASPLVQSVRGGPLGAFPSPLQLEEVENYVYGVQPPALDALVASSGETAIVVFALEYRPAGRTPHQRHADLCFSRSGVSRVGTTGPAYDPRKRQWEPLDPDDPYAFRVLPVRYTPFLAVARRGERGVLPDRFVEGDEERTFWVPVHKLFDGDECISGLELELEWRVGHVNEKLRRFHLLLEAKGYDTGWAGGVLDEPPFRFTDGIADLSEAADHGSGLLMPTVHEHFVAAATFDGKPLATAVPKGLKPARSHSHVLAQYFSGLELSPFGPLPLTSIDQTLRPAGRSHHAPEIANVRHEVLPDGTEVNLNDRPHVENIVAAGGYNARHYLDFTGDGWVAVTCRALAPEIPVTRAAYSIVSSPDYFPYCDQLLLMEWTATLPKEIRAGLWGVLPRPLSDTRYAANQTLPGGGFAPPDGPGTSDTTVTAIVCQLGSPDGAGRSWPDHGLHLRSSLPDGASGVFDPGWDVTTDAATEKADLFLVTYGLGTPFVEDAKICAALATYWPAAAPDATRTFQPDKYWPTISPLTDEEIGIVGDMPWDGIKGPVRVGEGPASVVEYTDIDYADYVDQALARKLTAALTARIDYGEYSRRVLAMAWLYWALGLRLPPERGGDGKRMSFFQRIQTFLLAKAAWTLLSFRVVGPDDPALEAALAAAGATLQGEHVYGGTIFRHGADKPGPRFSLRHVEILEEVDFYTDLATVLTSRGGAEWQAEPIPTS
jgi:hypothetical protein